VIWRAACLALVLAPLPTLAMAASTGERLDLLERRMGQVSALTLQLEQMRSENRQLRGEIELLVNEIEQLKRKQRDIYLDIDQRLAALSGEAVPTLPEPTDPLPTQAQVPDAAPATPEPPGTPVDRSRVVAEYEAAYALLSPQQKRYAEAAAALENFLGKYPDDPLAADAQYLLGDAHYVMQQNDAARQAFELATSRYPDNPKAPGALFKIGRLQQAAGDSAGARATFEKVLQDYPSSPAAGLARQRLGKSGV
jgi:tol-pal system protein YbgF